MFPNISRKILEQEQNGGEERAVFPLTLEVSLLYLCLRTVKIKVDRLWRKERDTWVWNIAYWSSDHEPWKEGHQRFFCFCFVLVFASPINAGTDLSSLNFSSAMDMGRAVCPSVLALSPRVGSCQLSWTLDPLIMHVTGILSLQSLWVTEWANGALTIYGRFSALYQSVWPSLDFLLLWHWLLGVRSEILILVLGRHMPDLWLSSVWTLAQARYASFSKSPLSRWGPSPSSQ